MIGYVFTGGMKPGAVVGIVLLVLLTLNAFIIFVICCCKKKNKKKRNVRVSLHRSFSPTTIDIQTMKAAPTSIISKITYKGLNPAITAWQLHLH